MSRSLPHQDSGGDSDDAGTAAAESTAADAAADSDRDRDDDDGLTVDAVGGSKGGRTHKT